jgi:hypothetical protein
MPVVSTKQMVEAGRQGGYAVPAINIINDLTLEAVLAARRRWTGDFEYVFQDQSSLLGAAMLGQIYQDGGLA